MGILKNYNRWSLGKQLKVTFITSTFFLTATLILITKFQLDWLREYIIAKSKYALQDTLLAQMKALGEIQANYISSEFSSYMESAIYLKDIELILQGYNLKYNPPPLAQSTPFWSNNLSKDEKDYNTGAYFSKFQLSKEGTDLVYKDTPLDKIYPILYTTKYRFIYQGYEIDEIIRSYPGTSFSSDYNPQISEWYFSAYENNGSVVLTEPYFDETTGELMVTSSLSFSDLNGNIIGVAGVDITLETLTEHFLEVKILETGYILLVSKGGMILVMPDEWKIFGDTFRIYNTEYTGITQEEWENFKNSNDGSQHTYYDANGTEIFILKKNIYSKYTGNNILYLFLCAKKSEIDKPTDDVKISFDKTYNAIFWTTITISILVFLSIIVLVYTKSRTIKNQLKMVEEVFATVIRKGLFPNVTKGVRFDEKNIRGIESLIEAGKIKLEKIKKIEDAHCYYNWGYTRPNDELLYNEWINQLYPLNYYKNKKFGWRQALPNLKDHELFKKIDNYS